MALGRETLKHFVTTTWIGRTSYKAYVAAMHYRSQVRRRPLDALRFVLFDPEIANFTYELENWDELERFVARCFGCSLDEATRLSRELREDHDLEARLASRLASRPDRRHKPLYGRRVGWYCAVRLLKPRFVIETGVSDGLGSAVLLRALERNRAEGHDGHLAGIDIDPTAGWLIDERLKAGWELVIEDSHDALPRLVSERPVDLFIHDSDHHYEKEATEYRLIAGSLSPRAVVLSDNAHALPALHDWSRDAGRRFELFLERPHAHFYRGAGLGVSLPADP
jgi:predicted O-methyltransferase YrrM